MKVSFVIPTYNHYALLHQILYDIYQTCSLVDEVLVVNDASTDEDVYNGLAWWKKAEMLPIREIRLETNHMFLKASNIGLKKAVGDVIILISNDVRVRKDVSTEIYKILSDVPHSIVGGRLLDFDTGWNKFDYHLFPYLEGWLLATTKTNWKELKYFDERFSPSDMEDIDLSTTALKLGYGLIPLPEGYTQHLGGQSIGFSPEREAITIANKEKFRKKWIIKNSELE